jgi:hypothetical protein
METRNILNLSFTLLLTVCLVLEMIARVVFLGTSLLTATLSLLIVAGVTVGCLWYASLPRTTPLTGLALLCRVVVATQIVLSAKELISTDTMPPLFTWGYALACLGLSVATAFTLERDLRLLLAANREK